ncbi:MAG: hypothetical protein V9F00_01855 [Nocardioides sp.]
MELPKPRFQVLPQGYVFSEVDGLINRINAALASGQRVPPGVVDATTFTLSTNSGYSVDDVATWLDDAFEVLSHPDPRPFPTGSAASADQQIGRPEPAQPGRHDAYDTVVASAGQTDSGWFSGGSTESSINPNPADREVAPLSTGYSAIEELPATPRWATALTVLVLLGLLAAMAGLLFTR